MDFLTTLALAHQRHEGYYPGSLAFRNNNPGNLRLTDYQRRVYGAVMGQGGFAHFPTYDTGLSALKDDLRAKLTGNSSHINYQNNPTFQDYVNVYAPEQDGNNPKSYAQALIRDLAAGGFNVQLNTPLSELAKMIDNKPPPPQHDPQPPLQTQLDGLQKQLGRTADPYRKTMIQRTIKHILDILHITP